MPWDTLWEATAWPLMDQREKILGLVLVLAVPLGSPIWLPTCAIWGGGVCAERPGWQAMHIAEPVLSITRKFFATWSIASTWGSWHVVHCTFPLTIFTFGLAVEPLSTLEYTLGVLGD